MRHSSKIRAAAATLAAVAAFSLPSAAQAETCAIAFSVIKAGWVIGGQGGSGALRCRGRTYPLSVGGVSWGIMFGASETRFNGRAHFNGSPYNVAGAYGAAGAGAALGVGAQAIVLRNEKGATLELIGRQVGLQINADLTGLVITMR
jgi:lipid-binding SYLF domain-containing protein